MPDFVRELPFEVEAALYEKEAMAEFAKENDKGGDCEGVNNILRRGIRIVRKARELINAPTIQQPEWISCVERLPTESGKYFVFHSKSGQCFDALFDKKEREFGEWIDDFEWNGYGWVDYVWNPLETITHWMPFPKPPKEGE